MWYLNELSSLAEVSLYMIMLTVLQKVLSQDLNCCVASLPQYYEWTVWKTLAISFNFTAIEINKYIVQKCMCTVYRVHVCCTGPYVR